MNAADGAAAARRREPVAVVGMACVFPGAANLEQFWANVVSGTAAFDDAPADRIDPVFSSSALGADALGTRRGAFLDSGIGVDAAALGLMPAAVAGMEPDQVIALAVAARALDDAAGAVDGVDRSRVGVALGKGGYVAPAQIRTLNKLRVSQQLVRTLTEVLPDADDAAVRQIAVDFAAHVGSSGTGDAIGMISNMSAARIANRLDLGGPAFTVDGACASSLLALNCAVDELDQGRCDVMVIGGVHHCHDVSLWALFSQLGALSAGGRVLPFDCGADGTLLGEGTGMVVLKRADDALRDGDRVYAIVEGVGVSSDGRATSVINPNPPAQQTAMRRAWVEAGADPRSDAALGLVEAHGTATVQGDRAELESMREVFGEGTGLPDVALGSVKALIGHTMASAGIAGLIKACLALHHATLPPTCGGADPLPRAASGRFCALKHAVPWTVADGATTRRAAVSAFGFGGVNAHAVLSRPVVRAPGEAAPDAPLAVRERSRRVRLYAADSPAELARLLERGPRDGALECGREQSESAAPCRAVLFDPGARSAGTAVTALRSGVRQLVTNDAAFFTEPLLFGSAGVVGLFPGLEPGFRPRSADLSPWFGIEAPTAVASDVVDHARQVFRHERLVLRALRAHQITFDAFVGVSFGEIVAAAEAGVLAPDDVERAIDGMSPAVLGVSEHPFALIAGPHAAVEDLIGRSGRPVWLTHDNSPKQCLVSGAPEDVRELLHFARGQGFLGHILDLRSGFHTPVMRPVADGLAQLLADLEVPAPTVPLWSARTAAPVPDDRAARVNSVARALVDPVGLRSTVDALWADGARAFVTVGSGSSAGLVAQVLRGRPHLALDGNTAGRNGADQALWVSHCLWAAGRRRTPTAGPAPSALVGRTGATARTVVPLHLGTPLVSLDAAARARTRAAVAVPMPHAATPTASAAPVAPAGAPRPRERRPAGRVAGDGVTSTLHISTRTMPYLRDHAFFRQAPDWPDEEDRSPVVPGTTTLRLLEDAAAALVPGHVVGRTRDLRLLRWIPAAPATDLRVVARAEGGVIAVDFEGFASADVHLVDRFPSAGEPPPAPPAGNEWPASTSSADYYTTRRLFHGPAFQVVDDVLAVGHRHVRGLLRGTDATGSLLDGAGQLLGCWLMETRSTNIRILPYAVECIEYFAAAPAAGEPVVCTVLVREISEEDVCADMELQHRGRTWARITGWRSRRFKDDPVSQANAHCPEHRVLSRLHPGNWVSFRLVGEDLPTRQFIMSNHLAADERREYAELAPPARRSWLAGRIAAKDAVRFALWADGPVPVFPAQIVVANEPGGRPRVRGRHGLVFDPPALSIGHCDGVAVAIARDRTDGTGPGIDVERVRHLEPATQRLTFTDGERELAADVAAGSTDSADRWRTAFWCAKEAVAKSDGRGLRGAPRAFVVTAVDAATSTLTVHAPGGRAVVHVEDLAGPPGEYLHVVAWTDGIEQLDGVGTGALASDTRGRDR